MQSDIYRSRLKLRELLKRLRLLPAIRFMKDMLLHRARRQRFLQFKRRYGDILAYHLNDAENIVKRVLVVSTGWSLDGVKLGLIKALEMAGFEPVVLIKFEHRHLLDYYHLASIREVIFWEEAGDATDLATAKTVVESFRSNDELLAFEYAGARVGRLALSTALRHLRLASLDLRSVRDRRILASYLALSMAAANQAQRIIERVRPRLVLVSDPVYTPDGELFDNCIANGIDVIAIEAAHKSNSLMLKRYAYETRDEHFASLSSESWQLLRGMAWTEDHREQLAQEIKNTYGEGDWYSVGWSASSGSHFFDANEIQIRLGIDPAKKTAFLFPHILWDASFSWGQSLFDSYAEWLIQAVRAACMNDQINWVIKIHPANVGKSRLDGFQGEPAEVLALREHVGALPPHVFIIPADSDISTFSLFGLMDYCLTVRGTVGIEAARLGIPVLTAGTGRYDHKGFTIDPDSREEYIDRLEHLQEIPRLSPAQKELAERFAYGLFLLRPFPLETVTINNRLSLGQEKDFNKIQINIRNKEDWYNAADLRAFAQWADGLKQTDFLMPFPVNN